MPEGGEGSQPSQSEQRGTPAQEQNTEWSEDERLASARKEFGENVEQLTQNLAELGNSSIEPEQGGKATQEKWAKLKAFFKSDNGKNLTFATGVWAAAAGLTAAADYWTDGQVSTFTKLAGSGGVAVLTVLGGMELALTMKHEIKQAASKGWGKIKKSTRASNQEPGMMENHSVQEPVIEDLGGALPEKIK